MMRQHSWIPIGGVILCLALSPACRTTAALELSNVSINTQSGNPLSLQQVENGIRHAGVKLGWTMKSTNPGEITGTFAWRKHSATVFIPYSSMNYSIRYKHSQGLKYKDEGDKKTIHQRYNELVKALNTAIEQDCSTLTAFGQ